MSSAQVRDWRDKVSDVMGTYLLRGYCMLGTYCDTCPQGVPLMRGRDGTTICVACREVSTTLLFVVLYYILYSFYMIRILHESESCVVFNLCKLVSWHWCGPVPMASACVYEAQGMVFIAHEF